MAVKDLGNPNYATHVANKTTSQVTGLAKRARAQKKKAQALAEAAINAYGTVYGSTVNKAYDPLNKRVVASSKLATARAKEAAATARAAQRSAGLATQEKNQMALGQQGVLARVRQNAEPGFISAESALESAKAYARKIGIDMETMDWSAKAALFTHLVDQQYGVMQMAYGKKLDFMYQRKLYNLSQRQQEDAQLAGAPQVVSTLTASSGAMTQLLSNLTPEQLADPAGTAAQFAASHAVDETAKALIADTLTKLISQAPEHVGSNGVIDLGWMRNELVSAVHTNYPKYAGYSEVSDALSDGVLLSSVNAANSGSDGGFNWFSSEGAGRLGVDVAFPLISAPVEGAIAAWNNIPDLNAGQIGQIIASSIGQFI